VLIVGFKPFFFHRRIPIAGGVIRPIEKISMQVRDESDRCLHMLPWERVAMSEQKVQRTASAVTWTRAVPPIKLVAILRRDVNSTKEIDLATHWPAGQCLWFEPTAAFPHNADTATRSSVYFLGGSYISYRFSCSTVVSLWKDVRLEATQSGMLFLLNRRVSRRRLGNQQRSALSLFSLDLSGQTLSPLSLFP
jgi:hypothetical protein